jgi:hypothetical protein
MHYTGTFYDSDKEFETSLGTTYTDDEAGKHIKSFYNNLIFIKMKKIIRNGVV